MSQKQGVTAIMAGLSLLAIPSIFGEENFRYIPGKKDFLGALQSCIHLPSKWSLQSELDDSNLYKLKMEMEAYFIDKTWLGVRVQLLREWLWVTGIKAPNFTANIRNGTCGVIGSVNSVPCHSKLPFICELTGSCPVHVIDRCSSIGDSVIFIGCNSHSWHSARTHCKNLRGDLVVVTDDRKLQRIWEIIRAKDCPVDLNNFYIGIRREDWITVEEWLHRSPENGIAFNYSSCMTLKIDERGHLSLVPEKCNKDTHVICRKEYEHDTTIKTETTHQGKEEYLPNTLLISLMVIPFAVLVLAFIVCAPWIYAKKLQWLKIKRDMREITIQYRGEREEVRLLNKGSINVVLAGPVGSGKSSLINSFIMAFGEKNYRDVALRGSYGKNTENKSKTKSLSPYMLSEEPVHPVALKGEVLPVLKNCDLTFWDMPGLPNKNDRRTRCLFDNLIAGRTKSGDTISKMMSTRVWISPCCEVNLEESTICKPDICIFVYAAHKDPPTKLATALAKAARKDLPIIAIMTNNDQFSPPSQDLSEDKGSKTKTIQKKFDVQSQQLSKKEGSESSAWKMCTPSQEVSGAEGLKELTQEKEIKSASEIDHIRAALRIEKDRCFSVTSYCDKKGLEKNADIEEKFLIIFKEIKRLTISEKSQSLQGLQEEKQILIEHEETLVPVKIEKNEVLQAN